MTGKTYAETHQAEIDKMRELGIQFREKITQVYIAGPGEAVPKRSYLMMGRSVHKRIVLACKILGISQWRIMEMLCMDLWNTIAKKRDEAGLPPLEFDVSELVRMDDILWKEQEFKPKGKKGMKVVVHENDGIPLALKVVPRTKKELQNDDQEDTFSGLDDAGCTGDGACSNSIGGI